MNQETELLAHRFTEWAERAYTRGIFCFTPFLGLREQGVLAEVRRSLPPVKLTLFGGCEGTERVVARFGDEEELGYSEDFPIVSLRLSPKAKKFAEPFTHRDILGAVLHLGLERDTVGDIVVREAEAYLFVLERVAALIQSELTSVRHTPVTVEPAVQLPEGPLFSIEERIILLQSERIDAAVAKVYSLSREQAQALLTKGLCFVDGRCCTDTSYTPQPGETISVRGYGRFVYLGACSTEKNEKSKNAETP